MTRRPRPGSTTPRPSAWRRSPPAPSPRSSGPLLADGAARPALAALRRRADLGRQVEPHLPRRIRRGRGRPAPAAARAHPADGPRHGPRAPRPDARSRARPSRCRACCTSAAPTARSARRSTSWSASSATSAATRCPAGYADTPDGARGDRRRARRRARGPAYGRPGRGRPRGLRPAGRASWSASCGAGRSSGRPRRRASMPALDALRDELVRTLPRAARRGDRPRRLPARQHGAAPDGAGPHRGGARLGDEHARRPVHRPRRAAGVLERGGRRRGAGRGADRRAGHRGQGLPDARAGRSSATRAQTGFDVTDVDWYQAFAFFKLAVVCQGIAARAAGGAMLGSGFDDAQRLVAPLVDAGRHLLA